MRGHINFLDAARELIDKKIKYEDYAYIPTVQHRETIKEIFKEIKYVENISLITLAIMLNSSTVFYISNKLDFIIPYIISGISRADNYFTTAYHCDQSVLFHKKIDGIDLVQKSIINILEKYFKVYNIYCLIRRCDDCTVVVGIAHEFPIQNLEAIYQDTVNIIESFSIYFFDTLMPIYTEQLPALKHSLFAKNKSYRASILKNRRHQTTKPLIVTEREKECLFWTSRGKASGDIAHLMDISEHTVNEYKKSIIRKLNVLNMTHAVREATKSGIIF